MAKIKGSEKEEKKSKGGAPLGNKNAIGNSGKRKYIETPEKLLSLFLDYKEATKLDPYLVHDFVGKDANDVRREKERPLSWVGFECYLHEHGIISDLSDYKENKNGSYIEYLPIIRVCKKYIEKDQFEGASAGIFQQNIIARKLGIADSQNHDHTTKGESINKPDYSNLTTDEKIKLFELLSKTKKSES